jgi:hypothetical protein
MEENVIIFNFFSLYQNNYTDFCSVEIEYGDARTAFGRLLQREANKEAIYLKG